jgi:hypothetical protein
MMEDDDSHVRYEVVLRIGQHVESMLNDVDPKVRKVAEERRSFWADR